jgi:non-specific serine/threonine protein kinase
MLQTLSDDPASAIPLFVEAKRGYAHSGVSAQYPDSLGIELATAYIFAGRLDAAAAVIDELLEQCQANGDLWNLSYALWGRGYLQLLRGDPARSEADLCESLRIKRVLRDGLGVALTLELLAWTAEAAGDLERAATLFGAVETVWESSGGRQLGHQRQPYEARTRHALGEARFEQAAARGRELPEEEIVDYALHAATPHEHAHGKAAPRRTDANLALLTPRQREVAEMVAQGMSNKEIASRLVVSLRTAEGHVESILTKLGFKTRTQIASWVTQLSAHRD